MTPPDCAIPGVSARGKPLLVATVTVSLAKQGPAKIKIKLTTTGKTLLKAASRLTLTANASFTPTGQSKVTATKAFTIKH